MNQIQIINQDNELYVDSRTVATGFEIEHKSLCKSLQQRFSDLKSINYSESGKAGGRPGNCYLLTERQIMGVPAICKTTDKTFTFQMALVDAFLAIRKQATALPTDPMEQAMLLASQLMAKQKVIVELSTTVDDQADVIKEMAPRSNFYESVVATEDWKPLWDFGKVCEIGAKKIFTFLYDHKWIYYNSQNQAIPYDKYIKNECLLLKEFIFPDVHGVGRRGYKVYISGKGETKILAIYHKERQMDLL